MWIYRKFGGIQWSLCLFVWQLCFPRPRRGTEQSHELQGLKRSEDGAGLDIFPMIQILIYWQCFGDVCVPYHIPKLIDISSSISWYASSWGTSRLIVRLIDSGDQYAVKPENLRRGWKRRAWEGDQIGGTFYSRTTCNVKMHIQRINSWGHPLFSLLPEHYLRFLGSFSQMNHPICWFLRRSRLKIGRRSPWFSMSFTVRTTEEEANELMGSSLEEQLWGLRLTKPRPNVSPAHEIFLHGLFIPWSSNIFCGEGGKK